jgi:hypothetical protein
MGCHRTNTKDFSEYANVESLSAQQGGVSLLEAYTTGDPAHLEDRALSFMPQASLMFTQLNADTAAQDAIRRWLELVTDPSGPTCRVTFRSNGPDFTRVGQDVWITGNTPKLGIWNPVGGLKLDGTAFPQWKGTIDLPQGETIEYKATVVNSATGAVIWEGGANRQVTIPTRAACTTTVTTTWRNP